jgi:hypothetical protein
VGCWQRPLWERGRARRSFSRHSAAFGWRFPEAGIGKPTSGCPSTGTRLCSTYGRQAECSTNITFLADASRDKKVIGTTDSRTRDQTMSRMRSCITAYSKRESPSSEADDSRRRAPQGARNTRPRELAARWTTGRRHARARPVPMAEPGVERTHPQHFVSQSSPGRTCRRRRSSPRPGTPHRSSSERAPVPPRPKG